MDVFTLMRRTSHLVLNGSSTSRDVNRCLMIAQSEDSPYIFAHLIYSELFRLPICELSLLLRFSNVEGLSVWTLS